MMSVEKALVISGLFVLFVPNHFALTILCSPNRGSVVLFYTELGFGGARLFIISVKKGYECNVVAQK